MAEVLLSEEEKYYLVIGVEVSNAVPFTNLRIDNVFVTGYR